MRMNTEGLLEKIRSVKDETADGKNRLPDRKVIVYILKETQVILMPEYFHFSELSQEEALVELSASLCKIFRRFMTGIRRHIPRQRSFSAIRASMPP